MSTKILIYLYQLLVITTLSGEAVKIGISKHLPMSTTQSPNNTTLEITTEDVITELPTTIQTSTTTPKPTTATTIKTTTNSEPEWPEFPPKKSLNPNNKTTTKKPKTTTIKPFTTTTTETSEINNGTEKSKIPATSVNKWPIKQKYCFCDLSIDTCDINCCCDRDCSTTALTVFRCLEEEPLDVELHEGRFEDFKFQHGLPSCKVNDGWLCVFRTNKPVIKEEVSLTYSDTSHYYKWPSLLMEAEDTTNREFYKYGDILKIINMQTKEVHNFDLPSSFKPPYCQIRESIFHLKSLKRSCLISTNEKLDEITQSLVYLQENYKILIKPVIPEELYNNKHLENYLGNITLKLCNETISNCIEYKFGLELEITELYKVKVIILHNYTNIQGVTMELWFNSNEDMTLELKEYWLNYEIEFLNKSIKELKQIQSSKEVKKKIHVISGPLGYLQGKSLILAKYVPVNNSMPLSSKNQVLNYFNENNTESNVLSLFSKHQGFCKHVKNSQEQISFGINLAKQCKIRLENDTLLLEEPSKTNFTRICLNLQDLIHEQLFGDDIQLPDISSYFISQLGKPQNLSSKWIHLEVFNTDFNSVFGQYLEDTNTFICRNILLSLAYEFHTATYMVDNVPLQNVLKHAVLHLGERHDLEFALDENLEVPITLTARFYDIHEKAVSASNNLRILSLEFLVISLVLILNI